MIDKKIIVHLLLSLLVASCCCSNVSDRLNEEAKLSGDTLYFNKGRVDGRLCKSSYVDFYGNYIVVKNRNGHGRSIWIDSILYSYCGMSGTTLVISKPDGWNCELVYFTKDTLIVESVSRNQPAISEHSFDRFRVISVQDSLSNSGSSIRTTFFIKLESDGRMSEQRKFGVDSSGRYSLIVKKDNRGLLVLKRTTGSALEEKYYFE